MRTADSAGSPASPTMWSTADEPAVRSRRWSKRSPPRNVRAPQGRVVA